MSIESRSLNPRADLVQTFPSSPSDGPVHVDFTSSPHGFDAPKLSAVNETAGQWYYFDVVSSAKEHVVVVFYSITNTSFPLGPAQSVDIVSIEGTFPNGTAWGYEFSASEAVITTVGDGASGTWKGTGMSFTGTPTLAKYTVQVNAPKAGIVGSINFESIAPAHYACAPSGAGHDMRVTPYLGWANAVADADATVDLHIGGVHLLFEGSGYHDQNWSSNNIFTGVASWYWGHVRFGPYSVVFSNIVDLDGTTKAATYVAKDRKIVTIDCAQTTIRPTGQNSQYPPTSKDGIPSGFRVTANLGEEGELEIDLSTRFVSEDDPGLYYRVLSNVSGGIKGQKQRWSGAGVNEEFTLT